MREMKLHYATNVRLNGWIRTAMRSIRFPLTRRTLRREFCDHFEDCRDVMLDRGCSEADADEKALDSLGSAKQTGKLLRMVYRPRIYAVRAAILLLLAILCLPWPKRISRQMYGRVYSPDGTLTAEVKFAVTGWKLDYLVRDDQIKLELIWGSAVDTEALFPPPELDPQEVLGYGTPGLYYDDAAGFWDMSLGERVPYDGLLERSVLQPRGDLRLSYDCHSCMIATMNSYHGWYILASDSPNADEAQLQSQFAKSVEGYLKNVEFLNKPLYEQ